MLESKQASDQRDWNLGLETWQLILKHPFRYLFIAMFGVRDRSSGHQRIQAEQEQHVEEEKWDDADDEDDNHLKCKQIIQRWRHNHIICK